MNTMIHMTRTFLPVITMLCLMFLYSETGKTEVEKERKRNYSHHLMMAVFLSTIIGWFVFFLFSKLLMFSNLESSIVCSVGFLIGMFILHSFCPDPYKDLPENEIRDSIKVFLGKF